MYILYGWLIYSKNECIYLFICLFFAFSVKETVICLTLTAHDSGFCCAHCCLQRICLYFSLLTYLFVFTLSFKSECMFKNWTKISILKKILWLAYRMRELLIQFWDLSDKAKDDLVCIQLWLMKADVCVVSIHFFFLELIIYMSLYHRGLQQVA